MTELGSESFTPEATTDTPSQAELELIKTQKETLQGYIDICKETYKSSNQEFDKQLVYIAGGGLALTIGFVKDIVSITKAIHLWLLLSTWICFVVALLFNFLSHKFSAEAADDLMDYLNHHKGLLDGSEKPDEKKEAKNSSANRKNRFVIWANNISIGVTILGIVCFIAFTFTNLINDRKPTTSGQSPANALRQLDSARFDQRPNPTANGIGASVKDSTASANGSDSASNKQLEH